MRGYLVGGLLMLALFIVQPVGAVVASNPATGTLHLVANLPNGMIGEGLAIDGKANVYVGVINMTASDGKILEFNQSGALINTFTIPGRPIVLGMLFIPHTHGLFALATTAFSSSASGAVVHLDVRSGAVTTVATGFIVPNGLAIDRRGNLFVTDSFAGTVSEVTPDGNVSVIASGPLLQGTAALPFGANGVALDARGGALYVSNTGTGSIIKIEIGHHGTAAGAPTVFASGIPTPDGIAFDVKGNLYVAANFANQIWKVSPQGNATEVALDTSMASLENPASLYFDGHNLYITNSAQTTLQSKVLVVAVDHRGLPLLGYCNHWSADRHRAFASCRDWDAGDRHNSAS